MAKSVEEMQSLLNDPDSLDMDDEDAILALANDAEVPDDAEDLDAEDLDKGVEKDADASAGVSIDADDKDKDAAVLTDDDIKAPIQSKNGKHVIPYNVLEETRSSLKTASTALEAKEGELTNQLTENALLKRQIDELKAGGDVTDEDLDAVDNNSTASTPEEEFLAKNGMDTVAFEKEYGADLTKSLLNQAKESLEMREQLGVLMEDHNQKAEVDEKVSADTLQGAIDAIPDLAAIQAVGGERWQEAIDTDDALRQMPKYRNADMSTRFTAVAKEMGLNIPTKEEADTSKNESTDVDDDKLPTSISDIPGGSPASQSEKQTMENMDSADVGVMFDGMTQAQQDDYLNNL